MADSSAQMRDWSGPSLRGIPVAFLQESSFVVAADVVENRGQDRMFHSDRLQSNELLKLTKHTLKLVFNHEMKNSPYYIDSVVLHIPVSDDLYHAFYQFCLKRELFIQFEIFGYDT